MTYQDIVEVMESHGVYFQMSPLDREYDAPSKEWFFSEFKKSFEEWLRAAKVLSWQAEGGDCDDLACWGRAHAKVCQARMQRKRSIVVGEFLYITKEGEGHAVVFALVGKAKKLVFLDRVIDQQGNVWIDEVKLTAQELESCLGWYV